MEIVLFIVILGGVAFAIVVEQTRAKEDPLTPMKTTANSSAGVASTPSSQGEYELIQFDEAMFTGGTTSQRFQERIGFYIKNGYRIHTMNVVVKQG